MELKFRTLKPEEIDVRIGQEFKDKNGVTLLLYKNARVDMDMLDEAVGPTNWQRRHIRENANCIVSIWDKDKNAWVDKEDTGTESYTEKEKGLASDSFKRACVNWGIGRELYTAPRMVLYGDSEQLKYENYHVAEIEYNENREIAKVVITNQKGIVVFPKSANSTTPKKTPTSVNTTPQQTSTDSKVISPAQAKMIFAIANGELEKVKGVMAKYGYTETKTIKVEDYEKICKELEGDK